MKGVSKQAIEIWILILIIPRNTIKLHAKKILSKYDKICICEKKSTRKLFSQKKKSLRCK